MCTQRLASCLPVVHEAYILPTEQQPVLLVRAHATLSCIPAVCCNIQDSCWGDMHETCRHTAQYNGQLLGCPATVCIGSLLRCNQSGVFCLSSKVGASDNEGPCSMLPCRFTNFLVLRCGYFTLTEI